MIPFGFYQLGKIEEQARSVWQDIWEGAGSADISSAEVLGSMPNNIYFLPGTWANWLNECSYTWCQGYGQGESESCISSEQVIRLGLNQAWL